MNRPRNSNGRIVLGLRFSIRVIMIAMVRVIVIVMVTVLVMSENRDGMYVISE